MQVAANSVPWRRTLSGQRSPPRFSRGGFSFLTSEANRSSKTYQHRHIAVGPPVAQRPPHRSRRAELPHRALQRYSLPQSGRRPRRIVSDPGPRHDSWLLHSVVFQKLLEASPGIAPSLASSVEPLEQDPQRLTIELLKTPVVAHYSIVLIVAPQLGVQLPEQFPRFQVPDMPAPLGETCQGGPQSLPCRPALQVRLPLPVFPPVELEPQKLKPSLARRRLSVERDHLRLRHRWL